MEKLIEQLKKALDAILEIKSTLIIEKARIASISQKQDEVAKTQAEITLDLEKREAAIKPIEDVVVFKKATEEEAARVNKGRIALDQAQSSFEAYRRKETDSLVARKQKVSENEALYKRELAALNKTKEEYETKKARVKAEVLGELAKNV